MGSEVQAQPIATCVGCDKPVLIAQNALGEMVKLDTEQETRWRPAVDRDGTIYVTPCATWELHECLRTRSFGGRATAFGGGEIDESTISEQVHRDYEAAKSAPE